jgi:uncharacterized protein (TIGR02466 family)
MIRPLYATPLMELTTSVEPWLELAQKLLPSESELRRVATRPWSTDDLLHEQAEFEPLVKLILAEADQLADLEGIRRRELYVTSMWINAQYQGQNHIAHTHPNSLYSGVIYLQVPEHSQRLVFTDPRPQAQVLRPRGTITNLGFQPRAGLWYMWPSWLQHATMSTTDSELTVPRISLSYNIMLRDTIDTHSSRLELK